MEEKNRGKLIGVSIGPGDPELMTLKAVRAIESASVIATPRTKSGQMLAFDIAKQAVDMSSKTVLPIYFTMSRDPEVLKKAHEEAADKIEEYLKQGLDVAMLNLGDQSVFGTYCYVQDVIRDRGYETEMVAGVTSFCAIASLLGISLTDMNRPLIITPGNVTSEVIDNDGTKVIMKSGKKLEEVISLLKEKGLLARSAMVADAGLPSQKIYKSLEEYEEGDDLGYFATIIVK
ncbi:MAG: precorrin-2 C(20)-methyltransferase [Eubacteriales bacterium]|nr:precorrin-2 C(20)-methyltransferase [Eubacteriales bacterium]